MEQVAKINTPMTVANWQPRPWQQLSDVIKTARPESRIATLRKEQYLDLIAAVIKLLDRSRKFFNVEKNMTSDQMATTAELIVGKYHWWTLDMISIMIDNGMSGKYGEVKYQYDGGTVMNWAVKFEKDRAETVGKLSRVTLEEESVVSAVKSSPVVQKIFQEILDKKKDERVNEMVQEIKTQRERTHEEQFSDWCVAEFNRRFESKGRYEYELRVISAYGKTMTETQFLRMKYEQRLRIWEMKHSKTAAA